MAFKNLIFGCFCFWFCSLSTQAAEKSGYNGHPEAEKWLSSMQSKGIDEEYLRSLLGSAKKQTSILKAMSRPAEKRLTWPEYRSRFLTSKRIRRGLIFWYEHEAAFQQAEQTYGVPAAMILAIIGVETHYGRNMGSYRVLDALATLGFDYPARAAFFQQQLSDLVTLGQRDKRSITTLKGSYAGAMGYGQFIPSSYLKYAVDFDDDGQANIWTNPVDAIGSVANYFHQHGWVTDQPVVTPVTLQAGTKVKVEEINTGQKPSKSLRAWSSEGLASKIKDQTLNAVLLNMGDEEHPDYLLGLNNYYVITRYNRSRLYAMAVYELSKALAAAKQKEDQVSK